MSPAPRIFSTCRIKNAARKRKSLHNLSPQLLIHARFMHFLLSTLGDEYKYKAMYHEVMTK
uniref:Uncharacterized protein n=1 Tax=Arundo donax TaxID=35708 RepID=A0A0A9GS35_ARUDO